VVVVPYQLSSEARGRHGVADHQAHSQVVG
jgi:hypothetical protein